MKLIFKAPINNLSLGNVSYNIIRELYRKNIELSIFPVKNNVNLESFTPIDQGLISYINLAIKSRYKSLQKTTPFLNLWHINGAEDKISNNNTLYTFHESGWATEEEVNILNTYDRCIFSCTESLEYFKKAGVENAHHIPIGFDEDFFETDKEYIPDKIHFGLMGKWEKRKNTQKIIKYWSERFGNNKKYQLTCCVNNAFLDKEDVSKYKKEALGNKDFFNINFLPWLKTNAQVNDYLNSIDIDLGGLSGGEGWNLPVFNSTCLGKWPVVLNCMAHKDWANQDNAIIIEPTEEEDIYDGVFFTQGSGFNQGIIHTFNKDQFNEAIDKSLDIFNKNKYNINGTKLKSKFTYSNTVDSILNLL